MSSRADKISCKFNIQHWKIENKETVNTTKLTEKKTADSAKKLWNKSTHNFFINFEKKLLLFDIQIVIIKIFNKQSFLSSVSSTSVLSFVYHSNSIISASFFILPFKIDLISIFNQSFYLLWNAVNYYSCVSVKKQNSPADQIRDIWYISNESQLQLYAQWESQWLLQMLNNFWWK